MRRGGDKVEDEEILELYRQRSEKAVEQTRKKYGAYCAAIARNILPDRRDAEECVGDTWLAAWNAIPPHRPGDLRTFLAKLTRRTALKRWRDNNRLKRGGGETELALEELGESLPSGGDTEDEVLADELRAAVRDFIRSLEGEEQTVFLRRYWYLEPVKSIASGRGYSEAKVNSMLHRTREKLREYLIKEGFK